MSIGITIVVNNPSVSTKLTSINGALSGTALVNKYYAKYSPDGSISEEHTQTMLSINKKQDNFGNIFDLGKKNSWPEKD